MFLLLRFRSNVAASLLRTALLSYALMLSIRVETGTARAANPSSGFEAGQYARSTDTGHLYGSIGYMLHYRQSDFRSRMGMNLAAGFFYPIGSRIWLGPELQVSYYTALWETRPLDQIGVVLGFAARGFLHRPHRSTPYLLISAGGGRVYAPDGDPGVVQSEQAAQAPYVAMSGGVGYLLATGRDLKVLGEIQIRRARRAEQRIAWAWILTLGLQKAL